MSVEFQKIISIKTKLKHFVIADQFAKLSILFLLFSNGPAKLKFKVVHIHYPNKVPIFLFKSWGKKSFQNYFVILFCILYIIVLQYCFTARLLVSRFQKILLVVYSLSYSIITLKLKISLLLYFQCAQVRNFMPEVYHRTCWWAKNIYYSPKIVPTCLKIETALKSNLKISHTLDIILRCLLSQPVW